MDEEGQEVRGWWARRKALRDARFEADLAVLKARAKLAPYEAKADIEWDMRWAKPVGQSWLTSVVVTTMATPVVAWFLPWTHGYAQEGLELFIKLDPQAPLYFGYGWVIMFAAVFGVGQVKNFLMPGRLATLVSAMGKAPDDVPADAVNGDDNP